jgi:ubiquitin-protein ligase
MESPCEVNFADVGSIGMNTARFMNKRPKMLRKRLEQAQLNPEFHIRELDKPEQYAIEFTPSTGFYQGLNIQLLIKTCYGTEQDMYYFPMSPPKVRFTSHIFHPNVSTSGTICADFLSNNLLWLLTTPNANHPLNQAAARLYNTCYLQYKKKMKHASAREEDALKMKCFAPYVEQIQRIYHACA